MKLKKIMALIIAITMVATLATAVSASKPGCIAPDICIQLPGLCDQPNGIPGESCIIPDLRLDVDEDFGKWLGAGTVSARIDGPDWRFDSLYRVAWDAFGNWNALDTVADVNFGVRDGKTILTLSENYLRTLTKGTTHSFVALFDDGFFAVLAVEIPENPITPATNAPAATAPAAPAAPGTGGTPGVPKGGVALAIIPTFLAAGVALVASKKRK
jgi:hypothetical protein